MHVRRAAPGGTGRSAAIALAVVLLVACLAAGPLAAKTLRFASAFDPQSLDPHALALLYQTRVVSQIYESLVDRDRNFGHRAGARRVVAAGRAEALALQAAARTSSSTTGRRSPRTTSCSRSSARWPRIRSARSSCAASLEARKVDDLTVDIMLAAPDAVLPEKLIYVGIMSKAWAAAHGVARSRRTTTPSRRPTRSATPTAPAPTGSRATSPTPHACWCANPQWWGQRGNVEEAIYVVIQSDATRLAALVSGRGRFRDRSAVPGRRAPETGSAASSSPRSPTSARSISASTRAATSCSSATSRAAIRSRTCACAAPSTQAIDIDAIVAKVLRGQATRDRLVSVAAGRRLRAGARKAPALRSSRRPRAAEGGRLPGRLRGDARLRQRRVPRRRMPGDRRHAGAGGHPDDASSPGRPRRSFPS